MGKRIPGNNTWNVNSEQTVNNYHSLGALCSIWCFNGGAFTRRQFPLEKLVYLQKARANPDGEDVQQEPFSGEMVFVC